MKERDGDTWALVLCLNGINNIEWGYLTNLIVIYTRLVNGTGLMNSDYIPPIQPQVNNLPDQAMGECVWVYCLQADECAVHNLLQLLVFIVKANDSVGVVGYAPWEVFERTKYCPSPLGVGALLEKYRLKDSDSYIGSPHYRVEVYVSRQYGELTPKMMEALTRLVNVAGGAN